MDLRREISYRLRTRKAKMQQEEILPNFSIDDFCSSPLHGKFPELFLSMNEACKRNKVTEKKILDRFLHISMEIHPVRLFAIEEQFRRRYLREKLAEMNVYVRKENEECVVLNHDAVLTLISYLDTPDLLSLVKAFYKLNDSYSKFQMQKIRKRKYHETSE